MSLNRATQTIPVIQLGIGTDQQECLVFNDSKKITNILRQLDDQFETIRDKISSWANDYYLLPLSQLTKETLIKKYIELMRFNQLIIDKMQFVGKLYQDSLGNSQTRGYKYRNNWLHLETSVKYFKQRKSNRIFSEYYEYRSPEFRWRLGAHNDRRLYFESLSNCHNPDILRIFNEESKNNQKIILEFDRIMLLMYVLRQFIRDLDSSISSRFQSLEKQLHLIQHYQTVSS